MDRVADHFPEYKKLRQRSRASRKRLSKLENEIAVLEERMLKARAAHQPRVTASVDFFKKHYRSVQS